MTPTSWKRNIFSQVPANARELYSDVCKAFKKAVGPWGKEELSAVLKDAYRRDNPFAEHDAALGAGDLSTIKAIEAELIKYIIEHTIKHPKAVSPYLLQLGKSTTEEAARAVTDAISQALITSNVRDADQEKQLVDLLLSMAQRGNKQALIDISNHARVSIIPSLSTPKYGEYDRAIMNRAAAHLETLANGDDVQDDIKESAQKSLKAIQTSAAERESAIADLSR